MAAEHLSALIGGWPALGGKAPIFPVGPLSMRVLCPLRALYLNELIRPGLVLIGRQCPQYYIYIYIYIIYIYIYIYIYMYIYIYIYIYV